jgi:hypothetical protein
VLVVIEDLVGGPGAEDWQGRNALLNGADLGPHPLRPLWPAHATEALAERGDHRLGQGFARGPGECPRQPVRLVVLDTQGHSQIMPQYRLI